MQIIDDEMFTMLVLMAVITTAMAGPLLGLLFSPRQLVLERAADNAASAKATGAKVSRGAARLVVLVHDVQSSARLLVAAVSTLAPNMRAHLDVAQFCPPRELHAQTEMGTGLLRSPEELNARTTLKEQLTTVQRRGLSSSVTVRTTDDPVAEALVHIRARDPQLVVTDWPASEEERAQLKELVVASPCTVVLWGGYSPTMNHGVGGSAPAAPSHQASGEPAEASVLDKLEANGVGAVASTRIKAFKPRPTLMELLRNETVQDEFADDVMAFVWRSLASGQAAFERRLPAFLRPDAAAVAAAREAHEDEIDDDEHGDHVRVNSDASVVTPHTMAVAAASSLSPKFSKLMVTGWPDNGDECAELVKFLHDVEHEVIAQRQSMDSRRSTGGGGGSYIGTERDVMPVIEEDGVQIIIGNDNGSQGAGILLRPKPGLSRAPSEENLDSVNTVGPMLSKMLGAALNPQSRQADGKK